MPLTITASTSSFITLDEVRAHCNISSTASDAELELFRNAAQDHVETLIGPVLWRSVTRTFTSSGAYALPVWPVVSVQSVTHGGVAYTAHTADIVSGLLSGLPVNGEVTVAYTAGRTSCPDSVRLAALLIVADLWETQLGNSPGVGALPQQDGEPIGSSASYASPRAERLLAPYLLVSVA